MGDHHKVIEYYQRALSSDLNTFGELVAVHRNNFGSAHGQLGEYDKAIEYYEQALDSDVKTLGLNHPDTAIDRFNLVPPAVNDPSV